MVCQVRSQCQLGRRSSKRIHAGEAIVLVPDLRYLTDSTTRAQEILPEATPMDGNPGRDSNPPRDRTTHPFGSLIAIPRNPLAIIRRCGPDQHFAVNQVLPSKALLSDN